MRINLFMKFRMTKFLSHPTLTTLCQKRDFYRLFDTEDVPSVW